MKDMNRDLFSAELAKVFSKATPIATKSHSNQTSTTPSTSQKTSKVFDTEESYQEEDLEEIENEDQDDLEAAEECLKDESFSPSTKKQKNSKFKNPTLNLNFQPIITAAGGNLYVLMPEATNFKYQFDVKETAACVKIIAPPISPAVVSFITHKQNVQVTQDHSHEFFVEFSCKVLFAEAVKVSHKGVIGIEVPIDYSHFNVMKTTPKINKIVE